MTLRLTRNLDKISGFVNGAIGQVESLLVHKPHLIVFTKLLSTGVRVLVHPVTDEGKTPLEEVIQTYDRATLQ